MNRPNPFSVQNFQSRNLLSPHDALILGVDTALLRLSETLTDVSDAEYDWEPLTEAERVLDIPLSAETKRVWRVFAVNGKYTYDYGMRSPDAPAFTTIAWIMNHIATSADMYLYCVRTGKRVGEEREWNDFTIYPNFNEMREYLFRTLDETRTYLSELNDAGDTVQLNTLTPAPWGEIRPTYLNLWGGIIEHALQHAMQIAVRKERIRQRF